MITVKRGSDGKIHMIGRAQIENIDELFDALRSLRLDDTPCLEIDLSGLEKIDSAAAQVLIAFKRSYNKKRVCLCSVPNRAFFESDESNQNYGNFAG